MSVERVPDADVRAIILARVAAAAVAGVAVDLDALASSIRCARECRVRRIIDELVAAGELLVRDEPPAARWPHWTDVLRYAPGPAGAASWPAWTDELRVAVVAPTRARARRQHAEATP